MSDQGFITEGERYSTGQIKDAEPSDPTAQQYERWYEAHFFYNALTNAADAVLEEAARAYKAGKDDVAFALREMSRELVYRAEVETDGWQKAGSSNEDTAEVR